MTKIKSIILGLLLLSSCRDFKFVPHAYNLGDKVLLKTGEQAVIYNITTTIYYGDTAPSAGYLVRVARRTTFNSSILFVNEFEIEKVIQ